MLNVERIISRLLLTNLQLFRCFHKTVNEFSHVLFTHKKLVNIVRMILSLKEVQRPVETLKENNLHDKFLNKPMGLG